MKKLSYIAPCGSTFPSREANSIHMMRMCEAFSQLKFEVCLYVSSSGSSEEEIFNFYGIKKSFKIIQLKTPKIKGRSLIYSLNAYRKIANQKPNIVVGRSVQVCMLTSLAKIPTIFDAHGPVWEKIGVESFCYKIMRNQNFLLRMTVNSKALKAMCKKTNNLPKCPIVVANNGANAYPLDDVPEKWPGRQNVFQVGYMGHLYQGRGVEVILSCAEKLQDMDFHIVGGLEKDIDFWKQSVALPNLFFHGFIKHAEVYKYRNKCDVLLAPYQKSVSVAGGGDSAGYMNPIKLIEYMSSKKPIICSDLLVLREVLSINNALFCPPDKDSSWVDALCLLQKNKEISGKVAMAAYEDFLNGFTWKSRAEKMLAGLI